MVQRILNIVGWVGTVARLRRRSAMRSLKPEWDRYAIYGALGRSCVRPALHIRTMARDCRDLPTAEIALRNRRRRQRGHRARHPRRGQLPVGPPQQALGPDSERGHSLSEQSNKLLGSLNAPREAHGVRSGDEPRTVPSEARCLQVRIEPGSGRLVDLTRS